MHDLNGSLREVKKLKFSLPQGTSPVTPLLIFMEQQELVY